MAKQRVTQIYKQVRFIGEVNELVEAASKLRARRIKITPHPDSLECLYRWTVEVELVGEAPEKEEE